MSDEAENEVTALHARQRREGAFVRVDRVREGRGTPTRAAGDGWVSVIDPGSGDMRWVRAERVLTLESGDDE